MKKRGFLVAAVMACGSMFSTGALAQDKTEVLVMEPDEYTVAVPGPSLHILISRQKGDTEQELETDPSFLQEIVPAPGASFL